jgi:hypothetical protein
MNRHYSISMEKEFHDIAHLLDRTGYGLAQEVLDALPEPRPKPQFPPMVKRGSLLRGGRVALARACGYTNITKGCRRVDTWVSGEQLPAPNIYPALAAGLEFSIDEIEAACANDHLLKQMSATRRRAAKPTFNLVVRMMAAVYSPITLAPQLTLREALTIACTEFMGRGSGLRRCLTLPNGLAIYIAGNGSLEGYAGMGPTGGLRLPLVPNGRPK